MPSPLEAGTTHAHLQERKKQDIQTAATSNKVAMVDPISGIAFCHHSASGKTSSHIYRLSVPSVAGNTQALMLQVYVVVVGKVISSTGNSTREGHKLVRSGPLLPTKSMVSYTCWRGVQHGAARKFFP